MGSPPDSAGASLPLLMRGSGLVEIVVVLDGDERDRKLRCKSTRITDKERPPDEDEEVLNDYQPTPLMK
ncbi:hypothetical protein HDU76_008271 [Blyttiomyces sp. JEL0837]|nr:hypothetical protein HDU76_008271 [Blyttiomyces sp. JEL0837]